MSGYMTLLHTVKVTSMAVPPDIKIGLADAKGLGCYLEPCWYMRTTLLQRPCQSEWSALPSGNMVTFKPKLLPGTMSGSIELPELGPVMSMTWSAHKGHTDAWV